jgi:hypothetical protein
VALPAPLQSPPYFRQRGLRIPGKHTRTVIRGTLLYCVMEISIVSCILSCFVLLPAEVNEQTWGETYHSETYSNPKPDEELSSFPVVNGGWYEWWGLSANRFVVTGDTTQEPNWRSRFTALANNHWWYHKDFAMTIPSETLVKNMEDKYFRTGTNTFINGSEEATRHLDEKVTNNLYPSLVPQGGGPG